ncbi:hypothetical protein CGLO_01075 [Colletotrichum gloeosporioides Cg-14]|uniref:Uncharacterized protein n=1 Tax=Colletotrichum gloeosporioides (strain Cg-14) TaxID=1237896 RepID=T0KT00_COLGC|nr:hypothetical protein CGLO_01075 [Colletotrichum gloeosporioides Cg-14]
MILASAIVPLSLDDVGSHSMSGSHVPIRPHNPRNFQWFIERIGRQEDPRADKPKQEQAGSLAGPLSLCTSPDGQAMLAPFRGNRIIVEHDSLNSHALSGGLLASSTPSSRRRPSAVSRQAALGTVVVPCVRLG